MENNQAISKSLTSAADDNLAVIGALRPSQCEFDGCAWEEVQPS